jgi:hypothetical protein
MIPVLAHIVFRGWDDVTISCDAKYALLARHMTFLFVVALALLAYADSKPWIMLFAPQELLIVYGKRSRFDHISSVFFCFVFCVYALARLTKGLVFLSFAFDTCVAYAWRAKNPKAAMNARYSVLAYAAMGVFWFLFPQLFLICGALFSLFDVRWDLMLIRIPLCVVAHF